MVGHWVCCVNKMLEGGGARHPLDDRRSLNTMYPHLGRTLPHPLGAYTHPSSMCPAPTTTPTPDKGHACLWEDCDYPPLTPSGCTCTSTITTILAASQPTTCV